MTNARAVLQTCLSKLVAIKNLDEGVAMKSKAQCEKALLECEQKGIDPGYAGHMAQLVMQPEKLLGELVEDRRHDLDPFRTFSVQEFVDVETEKVRQCTPSWFRR